MSNSNAEARKRYAEAAATYTGYSTAPAYPVQAYPPRVQEPPVLLGRQPGVKKRLTSVPLATNLTLRGVNAATRVGMNAAGRGFRTPVNVVGSIAKPTIPVPYWASPENQASCTGAGCDPLVAEQCAAGAVNCVGGTAQCIGGVAECMLKGGRKSRKLKRKTLRKKKSSRKSR